MLCVQVPRSVLFDTVFKNSFRERERELNVSQVHFQRISYELASVP